VARAASSVGGAGLLGIGSFTYFYYDGVSAFAALLLLSGTALVAVAFWSGGAGDESSSYVQETWSSSDLLIAGSALLSVMVLLLLRILGSAGINYMPFPQVSLPAFHPLAVFALLFLLAPAALPLTKRGAEVD
jgi:hypothetical protein